MEITKNSSTRYNLYQSIITLRIVERKIRIRYLLDKE